MLRSKFVGVTCLLAAAIPANPAFGEATAFINVNVITMTADRVDRTEKTGPLGF